MHYHLHLIRVHTVLYKMIKIHDPQRGHACTKLMAYVVGRKSLKPNIPFMFSNTLFTILK